MDLRLPPLHRTLRDAATPLFGAAVLPPRANPSLVWDRFPRVWGDELPADARARQEFLARFVAEFSTNGRVLGAGLAATHSRMGALADSRRFVTLAPLVSGLGAEHPTENGFRFDPLVGVPFLPGSGLKGLARAAATLLGVPSAETDVVLGPANLGRGGEGGLASQGDVVFLGAWPDPWPQLRVELISPHHPEYQSDQSEPVTRRNRVASYMEEPVPVAFLAVAPSAGFRVYLTTTGRGSKDLSRAWEWLTVGLEFLGAGAKTASGYGRMRPEQSRAPVVPTPRRDTGKPQLLVIFEAPIGGRAVAIAEKEVVDSAPASAWRRPPVRIDLGPDRHADPIESWPADLQRITAARDTVAARIAADPERPEVTIAALAPMPLLIALGYTLGDTLPAEALLKRRDAPWGWADPTPEDPRIRVTSPSDPQGDTALLINLSGVNRADSLPEAASGRWACWEVSVDQPSVSAIRSSEQRDQFKVLLRDVLSRIAALRPGQPVHVFPAMAAALAVELGRLYLPRGWPELRIWDRQGPQWTGPFVLAADGAPAGERRNTK